MCKRKIVFLLFFIAFFVVFPSKSYASNITPKATVDNSGKNWTVVNKRLKFIPSNHTDIRDSFIQLPEHYRFSIEGQDYMVIGGCWYIDSNGFLATPNNNKNMIRSYYVIDSGNERTVKQDMAAKTVLSHVPADGVPIKNQSFYWRKGTGIRGYSSSHNYFSNANHSQYFPFEKETIIYIPNANTSFTGIAQGGAVCYIGKAYDGYFLGRNGLMQTVKNGKIQNTFSGTLTKYFDEKSGKLVSIPTSAYRNGKPISGWVTSGGEYVYGYYNSLGRLDENKNYWVKQSKKKWYYLEKGRIYRRKDRKRGIAQKPLSSKNLNFYGNSKATPGKFYYYLNSDGSLITDVFSVDSAWKGKKMRIFVNLKGGVDNVSFMGYYKGSYTVPLKTVVNSSSKKASVRRSQIRGKNGRGYWYLGVTNKSRQRWFVFTKTGGRFYYQYATSILGAGALFHSPRFMRKNHHSLYLPHFNAMGSRNITTKCVRMEVGNAKLVYDISRKAHTHKVTVKFISKGKTAKGSYLPFGHKRLKNTLGTNSWRKHYDPSDPSI